MGGLPEGPWHPLDQWDQLHPKAKESRVHHSERNLNTVTGMMLEAQFQNEHLKIVLPKKERYQNSFLLSFLEIK